MMQGFAESNNVKKVFFGENSLKKFGKIDILQKTQKRIFILDKFFKNKKLSLNFSKTDSQLIEKTREICSKDNKIFMSLYKKKLMEKNEVSR